MSKRGIFAATLQETWRKGSEELTLRNHTCLFQGFPQESNHTNAGVGLILSPEAAKAWANASRETHNDLGPRILAIRLQLPTAANSTTHIFLISAYAPVSSSIDSVWQDYYQKLETCINRSHPADILIIGSDCNACLGISSSTSSAYNSIGPHGINHQNASGSRLLQFLLNNNLSAVTTFFKKPIHKYITWINKSNGNIYQIDHFISRNNQRNFFKDATACAPICTSDHSPLLCVIKFRPSTSLNNSQIYSHSQAKISNLDISPLKDQAVCQAFCDTVKNKLSEPDSAMTSYTQLSNSVKEAAAETFLKKQSNKSDWFYDSKDVISPAIKQRNLNTRQYTKCRNGINKTRLRNSQIKVKMLIRKAKNK